MWGQRTLSGVGFLLHFVGSRSQTQVVRHWWQAFYPRSDLIGPTLLFWDRIRCWTWSLSVQLDGPVNKVQESDVCLLCSVSGLQACASTTGFLHMCWGPRLIYPLAMSIVLSAFPTLFDRCFWHIFSVVVVKIHWSGRWSINILDRL